VVDTAPFDASAFAVHRTTARDGVEIAYVREGAGGLPVVLVHGWPGSKRLFWRNIAPLAAAGFEVIVPDMRGFGDSGVPADRRAYADPVTCSHDVADLLAHLGHDRVVAAGGDFGSGVVQDLSLRFEGLVVRQVLWNGLSPHLPDEYAAAGIPGSQGEEVAAVSDHLAEHGDSADALAAALDTPEKRRAYVEACFTGRVWRDGGPVVPLAAPGAFDAAAARFQAEPFEDAAVFRASLGLYEAIRDASLLPGAPRLLERNTVTETLVLYGVEDGIVGPNFARRAEVAFGALVGLFLVQDAGHFVQWERPALLNGAIRSFCRDLL